MLKLNQRKPLPLLVWGGLVFLSCSAPVVWMARAAFAVEVNWDAIEWTPLDDKAQSGIDWRFAPGSVAQGNALEWNYQFRNRYQKTVKFQSTLNYEDQDGAQKTEVKSWILGPQESRGAFLIGKKLGSVEITKPEVAKPTDTASTIPSPERSITPPVDAAAAAKAEAERKRKQETEQQAEIDRQAEINAEIKRQNEITARQAQEAEKQQEAVRQTQEKQRLETERTQAAEKALQQEAVRKEVARKEADAKAAEQQKAADKAVADAQAFEAAENARTVQKQQEEAQKGQLAEQQRQTEVRLQQAEARAQQAELRARQAEEREKQALEKAQLEAKTVLTAPVGGLPVTAPEAPPLVARVYNPAENGAISSVERGGASWRLAPQAPLAGHANAAGALAFSPDGAILASCSWRQVNGAQSSEIILRDATSGQTLQNLQGRWLTAWNGKGAKPPWVGHWGKINSLAFSPDGTQLASGGEDGRITFWDVKGGKALKTLEKSARPVLALSYVSPQSLSALSRDGKVLMWNLGDNRVQTLPLGTSNSGDWVRVGAFSRDGTQVAIGDANGALTIWNVPGGSLARRLNNSLHQDLEQPQGVEATALSFSPDGRLLISANHAHIYLNSVQKSPDFPDYRAKVLFAGQRVRQLVWASDAQSALAVAEGKAVLVNPRGKTAAEANLGELTAPGTAIREIAVSPLQNTFATGGAEGNVVLWK